MTEYLNRYGNPTPELVEIQGRLERQVRDVLNTITDQIQVRAVGQALADSVALEVIERLAYLNRSIWRQPD
jgi:hypothetical protein